MPLYIRIFGDIYCVNINLVDHIKTYLKTILTSRTLTDSQIYYVKVLRKDSNDVLI